MLHIECLDVWNILVPFVIEGKNFSKLSTLPNSNGLQYFNGSLYQVGQKLVDAENFVYENYLYGQGISNNASEEKVTIEKPAPASFVNEILYDPLNSIYWVSFEILKSQEPTVHTTYRYNPTTGMLEGIIWNNRLSGNSGGSVEGIIFIGNTLWYLNAALERIVKSEVTDEQH